MGVAEETRHIEVTDSAAEEAPGQIGLPAQAEINGQTGSGLPVVLRIQTEIVPLFIVVADIRLTKRTQRAGDEIGHGVAGNRAGESIQTVAIHAKRCRLHWPGVIRSELHLVRSLHYADVVTELVGRGIDQSRSRESSGAHEIAGNIDVGVIRQRLSDPLNANTRRRENRHLKLSNTDSIECRVKCVEEIRAERVGVA